MKYHRRFEATRDRAIKVARRIEDHINSRTRDIVARNVAIDYAIEEFTARQTLSKATQQSYRILLNEFARLTGWPDSDHWTVGAIDEYIQKRLAAGKSRATINKGLRTLNAFFAWAVARDWLDANPFTRLPHGQKRLRELRKVRTMWTVEQFEHALEYCPNSDWRIMALLSVSGAGRVGSLAQLTVDNVDFKRNLILVSEAKTGKSREAPLSGRVMKELADHVNDLPDGQVRLFRQHRFQAATWTLICKRAKLPHVTLHHLRRLLGTWLAERGVRDEDIALVFDHSDPRVTRQHYQELNALRLRRKAIARSPI